LQLSKFKLATPQAAGAPKDAEGLPYMPRNTQINFIPEIVQQNALNFIVPILTFSF